MDRPTEAIEYLASSLIPCASLVVSYARALEAERASLVEKACTIADERDRNVKLLGHVAVALGCPGVSGEALVERAVRMGRYVGASIVAAMRDTQGARDAAADALRLLLEATR